MTKISITAVDLSQLRDVATRNGTLEHWSLLACEWAESMSSAIEQMQHNFHNAQTQLAAKDAEIERLTEDRRDNYQQWLNILGQPLNPSQPEVLALIDHALRAYSELREQAIRACMWLHDDGSPCDGPRFREEQSKLRAMLGRDKWWRPEDADAEGGGE